MSEPCEHEIGPPRCLKCEIERLTREIADYEGPRIAELLAENTKFTFEIERLTRLVKVREAEIDWHVDEDKRLTRANEARLERNRLIQDQNDRLTRELDHFKNSGIIEVAVRNPNVSSYMDHWEGRATKAEAEVERLTRELEEERELHLTARSQSDAYEMGMESWKAGCERLTRELEAMEDARDIAQAEGALMEMDRDRLRAALIAWHEACDDEEREWARERGLKALSQEPKP